jgi:cation:H+ antiporter
MESLFNGLPVPVNLLATVASLAVLVAAADFAISRAIDTAQGYGVSPLIIGTTLVAMSTSLAELAVNLAVTLSGGNNQVVVGNVLGSNLVNIGLGLGIAAFITAIHTQTLVIEREILLYFAITTMLVGFALDKQISRLEGGILTACFLLVMVLVYQYASRERVTSPAAASGHSSGLRPARNALEATAAVIVLVLAAEVLVQSVSTLARTAGIDEYIISATVIGIGTSIPEIATSIGAARRGQVDLVLGNVFGSNVFNICLALGLPALIRGVRLPPRGVHDLYFLNVYGVIVAFLLLGDTRFLGQNKVIGRWGGALIALVYVGYIAWKIVTRQ